MTIRIAIEVDAHSVRVELQRIRRQKLSRLRRRIVEILADEIRRGVVERTPVESGEARAGWSASVTDAGFATEANVVNRVEHIIYLEEGTRRMRPRQMAKRSLAEVQSHLGAIVRRVIQEALG